MNAPFLLAAIGFMAGVLIGNNIHASAPLLISLGFMSGVASLFWRGRKLAGFLALVLLWVVLGVARVGFWKNHPAQGAIPDLTDKAQRVILQGVLCEDWVKRAQARGPVTRSSVLQTRAVYQAGHWVRSAARLKLILLDSTVAAAYGDEVLIEAAWLRVQAAANPGQYDQRRALARKHVHGMVRVKPSDTVVILRHDQGSVAGKWLFRWRHRLEQVIGDVFEKRQAGLLRSFLLGERTDLEDCLEKAFVETGTMHLLVVSGFNVGLIAWIVEWLLRLLGLPWRLRPWLTAIAVGGYCLLTGMQPPVVRAGFMAWVVLGAVFCDRVVSWPNTLSFAALVTIAVDPMQLFDPSFQLSYGAVASLLLFTPRWQPVIERGFGWIPSVFIKQGIVLSVTATAAIWAGLSPVLAWYFGLICPVSLIANLLIAPWVSVLVGVGTPLLFLSGAVFGPLLHWTAPLLGFVLKTIVFLVTVCHRLPFGHYYVAHPALVTIVGYYCLILISVNKAALRLNFRHLAALWLIALGVWVGSLIGARVFERDCLQVDFLDVGHGDSLVIRTPKQHVIIIDCGTQDAGHSRLIPFLRHEGISVIDALVLTHTDEDHLGGAIPLMETFPIKQLLTNGVHGDTMSAYRVRRLIAEKRIPEHVLAAGQRVLIEPEITLDVLHPPLGGVPGVKPKSNDNCLVLRLVKREVSFLFTGDIEEIGLPMLVETRLGRTTVLKVPHHGSRLGTVGERFFGQVSPRVSVISAGYLHRLPAQETVDRLRAAGSRVYLTRQDGMISVRTDGQKLFVKTFHDD